MYHKPLTSKHDPHQPSRKVEGLGHAQNMAPLTTLNPLMIPAQQARVERLKFAQQKRAEDALKEQEEDEEEGSFAEAQNLQTLQRKVSTVHSLAAYTRPPGLPCPPASTGGLATSAVGMMGLGGRRSSSAMGAGRSLVRSGSLLGGAGGAGGGGVESSGQVKSNKGFFFDTRAKGEATGDNDEAKHQQVSA
jgi:hypothetical protein